MNTNNLHFINYLDMQVRSQSNNHPNESAFTIKMKNVFASIKNCFSLMSDNSNSSMSIQKDRKHSGILDKIKQKLLKQIPNQKQIQKTSNENLFKLPVIKKVKKQQKIKRKSKHKFQSDKQLSSSSSENSGEDELFSSDQSEPQIRQLPPKKSIIPISQNSSIIKNRRIAENSIQSGYSLVQNIQEGQNLIDLSYSSDSGDMGQIDDMNPDFPQSQIQNPKKNIDFKKIKTNAFKSLVDKITEERNSQPFISQRQNSYLFYRRYQPQITKHEKIRQIFQKHKKHLQQRSRKQQQFNSIAKKKSQILETKTLSNRYQKDSKLIQQNIKGIFNNLKSSIVNQEQRNIQSVKPIKQNQVQQPIQGFTFNFSKPQPEKVQKINIFTGNPIQVQQVQNFQKVQVTKPQETKPQVDKPQVAKPQAIQIFRSKKFLNQRQQNEISPTEQIKPNLNQASKKQQISSSNVFTPKKQQRQTLIQGNPFKSGSKNPGLTSGGLNLKSIINDSKNPTDINFQIDHKWEQKIISIPNPPLLNTPQSSKNFGENLTPIVSSMQDESQQHSEALIYNEIQQQTTPFDIMNKPVQSQPVSWNVSQNTSPNPIRPSFMTEISLSGNPNSLNLLNYNNNISQSLFSESYNQNPRQTGRRNKKKDVARLV